MKCLDNCTCGKHKPAWNKGLFYKFGSCPPNCTCKRHLTKNSGQFKIGVTNTNVKKCLPDCKCQKHFRSKEHSQKIALSKIGVARSKATKQKLSFMAHNHWEKPNVRKRQSEIILLHLETVTAENCTCMAHNPRYKGTSIEIILRSMLSHYPDAICNKRFGRYEVDVYIPSIHTAFEADGEYWHRNRKERDAKRDQYLLDKFQLPVIRYSDTQLQNWNKSR